MKFLVIFVLLTVCGSFELDNNGKLTSDLEILLHQLVVNRTTIEYFNVNVNQISFDFLRDTGSYGGVSIFESINNPEDYYVIMTLSLLFRYLDSDNYNFIDIGSNLGLLSLIAAKYGFNVEAYDIHPYCVSLFNEQISANNLGRFIKPHLLGIGDVGSVEFVMDDLHKCDPGFSVQSYSVESLPSWYKRDNKLIARVPILPFNMIADNSVNSIVKIDAEGHEGLILQSILQEDVIPFQYLIIEIAPTFWPKMLSIKDHIDIFSHLLDRSEFALVLIGAYSEVGLRRLSNSVFEITDMREFLLDLKHKFMGTNILFSFDKTNQMHQELFFDLIPTPKTEL